MAKKKLRKIIEKDGEKYSVRGVRLTRAGNTMTESEFRSWVLSGLRSRTRYWPPANAAWKLNTRPSQSSNKRLKIEHQCNICKEWFSKAKMQLDHIKPIGGLSCLSKLQTWVERAFVEVEGYQKICKPCHKIKSRDERNEGRLPLTFTPIKE